MEHGSGLKARLASRLRGAAGADELEAKIAALEAQVREYENVHIRFAELIDLVQELLVPIAQQDQEKVDAAIARFTDELDQ